MLEWKKQDDRWIAYVGAPGEGWYEVKKSIYPADEWKCRMIRLCTNGRMGLASLITAASFEQAKQVAERHWETGVWAA